MRLLKIFQADFQPGFENERYRQFRTAHTRGNIVRVGRSVAGLDLFYFWFPSVDYKVGETDETISITGKRGETLTFLMKPGSSVGAK